jgi:hypothetical protein
MMSAIDLIASAPKRQSWLFVVVGAVGVAMLLIFW